MESAKKNQSVAQQEFDFTELDAYIDALPQKKGALIAVLHKAQSLFGYVPRSVQSHIARKLNVHTSKVYGVVSFYSFLRMEPRGKTNINVCMGTACFVRGAQDILDEFQKQLDIPVGGMTKDGYFSLESLRCVGACGLAPVVMAGDKVYGRVTVEEVSQIIEEQMIKEDLADGK